jgi:HPt (histidine-containing phosphotransfer) domain-containing protein
MSDNPILDASALDTLLASVGGDKEFLTELIDTYFADSPKMFDEMRQSLQVGNPEVFRRAAHSLKSNSANFGAGHLAALAKTLEGIGKSGQFDGAEPLIAQAADEYERVKTALAAIRNG